MSSRDEIEAIVRKFYAHRCADDLAGMMALFGPDPRFRIAGDGILGELTKEIQGREALRPVLEGLIKDWDWSEYRIGTVLVDGNRAAAHGRGTMRYVRKNEKIPSETLDLLTIVDGRITQFLEFCDTHMAAKAMDIIPK